MVGPPRPKFGAAAANPEVKQVPMSTYGGGSYPTSLEPLTKNEMALLDMYAKIKGYEKEAARMKAEEAKRRLEEADERYRAKVKEIKGDDSDDDEDDDETGDRTRSKKKNANSDDDGSGSDQEEKDHSDEDSDDDDEEGASERRKKRAQEISKLRKDVHAARSAQYQKDAEREAAKEREEAMRRELLGEEGAAGSSSTTKRRREYGGDDDDDDDEDEDDYDDDMGGMNTMSGPSIKKKRVDDYSFYDDKPKPSLIANIGGASTPVHDFSKKLGMGKASLDGNVLFPEDGAAGAPWQPPRHPDNFLDGCLELELSDFDPVKAASYSGNNTIAIKFHVPQESKRFSINIATPNHDDYNNVLFHFNPRQRQRGGQLVINDRKESMWGNDISVPLSTMPLMFGKQACTLVVQINDEGFDVFVEGHHCARLEHRSALPTRRGPLLLQFPSSDDYGNPENWLVYRVWWGRKESMAGDLNGVAGVNIYSAVHPRKLFVSGLTKLRSDPEIDLRRAELERAFRKYGGPTGAVTVIVPKDSTFAFVEVVSEQQADLALLEMANRYRINKARRTKHEALLEERAAKEAMNEGKKKESSDWD